MKNPNIKLKKINLVICFLTVQLICALPCFAQNAKDLRIIRETNKVALVIGNSDYKNGFSRLNSPRNDAQGMGEALKRLGFRLVENRVHTDVSHKKMEELVKSLTNELKNGGVGFFYFSGHGSQNRERKNFLVPVNTNIETQSDLKYGAMNVEYITDKMEESGNRLNILVLDACRNNPLPGGEKTGGGGLNTNAEVPSGVYIAFAARDGQTALDGDYGGYSLYTRELLKNIEEPNERLEDIFIATRAAVKDETKNRQSPFDYGSIDGKFYFKFDGQNLPSDNILNNSTNTSNRVKEAEAKLEQMTWDSIKNSRDKAKFQAYLNEFPNGKNASPARAKLSELANELNSDEITNSIGMKFIKIPGKSFYMGKYEVTQAEWESLMGLNPSKFRDCPQCPVERVSWYDVKAFTIKLNSKEGKEIYRLPFQEEREYVMKGGEESVFFWGNSANQADDYAWYQSNSGGTTHMVGMKKPNQYGLYDLAGNVWEWCEDGDDSSLKRVNRGGGWNYSAEGLGSSYRFNIAPNNRQPWIGFRLVRIN